MRVSENITIQEWELIETFIRATGPGGQNVNKVATAVQLRFDAKHSPSLPDEVKARLLHSARRYITKEGVLIITAQRFRTQDRNRQDARDRLLDLITKALYQPKKRIATKPTKSSKENRLHEKSKHSQIKSLRKTVRLDID